MSRLVVAGDHVVPIYAEVVGEDAGCRIENQACAMKPAAVKEIVGGLGANGGSIELMHFLARRAPRKAISEAIHGLSAETGDMWNMCARVRFLEGITRERFRPINRDFSPNTRGFFPMGEKAEFCVYWMTRGQLLLSPPAVRKRIVARWSHWRKKGLERIRVRSDPEFIWPGP